MNEIPASRTLKDRLKTDITPQYFGVSEDQVAAAANYAAFQADAERVRCAVVCEAVADCAANTQEERDAARYLARLIREG